jgi:hypothetical protein
LFYSSIKGLTNREVRSALAYVLMLISKCETIRLVLLSLFLSLNDSK